MKASFPIFVPLLCISVSEAEAATLSFTGFLEHTATVQVTDWHIFEVTRPTTLQISSVIYAGNNRESWLVLGAYGGGAELLGVQLVLGNCGEVICFNHSQALGAGQWGIGFAPVSTDRNPAAINDAAFPSFMFNYGPSRYTLTLRSEGSDTEGIRWLEHREGNLDDSFTITSIPEPSAPALLAASIIFLLRRNAVPVIRRTRRGWTTAGALYFLP